MRSMASSTSPCSPAGAAQVGSQVSRTRSRRSANTAPTRVAFSFSSSAAGSALRQGRNALPAAELENEKATLVGAVFAERRLRVLETCEPTCAAPAGEHGDVLLAIDRIAHRRRQNSRRQI